VIAGENESLGELDSYPTCWFNRLGALIDDTHVEELVTELLVDVLA